MCILMSLGWQFRGNGGNFPPNFLNLLASPVRDHVSRHGLGGEQRRPQEVDFQFGSGPFTTIKGLHRQLTIDAGPDWGCPARAGLKDRRKVILWSRRSCSRTFPNEANRPIGGRLVAATTETEAGPLDVVGVCIRWRNAHVATYQKDREPWEEHLLWQKAFETKAYRTAYGLSRWVVRSEPLIMARAWGRKCGE